MIIVLHGLPGVGKSTLSAKLSEITGGVVLGTNYIRKHVLKHKAYAMSRVQTFPFSQDVIDTSYSVMIYCAELLARSGVAVILDATFQKNCYIEQTREAALRAGTELIVLQVVCDEGVCQMRMEERVRLKQSDSIVNYAHHQEMKEKYFEFYNSPDFIFDTSANYESQLQQVRDILSV